MAHRKYDSTVARMAGNILSGLVGHCDIVNGSRNPADPLGPNALGMVRLAVQLARAIVAETERTEEPEPGPR